jgi:DNA-directed RNA polymerase alpha subunit
MNDITLRDLLRFIDDDMKLNIQMTDSNGDVRSVSGFVRDLVVMLGAETLNRKVDIMMQTVLHEVCISVFQEMNAENMQDVKLPSLYEALKEYPAIARRLQESGVMTTEELISMTAEGLKAIGHIGSTAVCRIRTGLAKNGLHLKGEEL